MATFDELLKSLRKDKKVLRDVIPQEPEPLSDVDRFREWLRTPIDRPVDRPVDRPIADDIFRFQDRDFIPRDTVPTGATDTITPQFAVPQEITPRQFETEPFRGAEDFFGATDAVTGPFPGTTEARDISEHMAPTGSIDRGETLTVDQWNLEMARIRNTPEFKKAAREARATEERRVLGIRQSEMIKAGGPIVQAVTAPLFKVGDFPVSATDLVLVGSLLTGLWVGSAPLRANVSFNRLPERQALVSRAQELGISRNSPVFKDAETALKWAFDLHKSGQTKAADALMRQFRSAYQRGTPAGRTAPTGTRPAPTAGEPFVPRATQTGAMAQGTLPTELTNVLWDNAPIAQKVANVNVAGLAPSVANKPWEALTSEEKQALSNIAPVPSTAANNIAIKISQGLKLNTTEEEFRVNNADAIENQLASLRAQPETTTPVTEVGQPEAGLQKGMFGEDKVVRPAGKGVTTQASLDDQLKLDQARGAVTPEVSEKVRRARIKELIEQAKPFVEKEGLTPSEAAEFKALSKEIRDIQFSLVKPLDVTKIKSAVDRKSTLTPEVIGVAHSELIKDKAIFEVLVEGSEGVAFDTFTPADRILARQNPDISPRQLYNAFQSTRDVLRQQHGDTIKLFRATGKQIEKPTTNWATTEAFAKQFGEDVISREIPIDNVIAVNVGLRGNYHELIVGQPQPTQPVTPEDEIRLGEIQVKSTGISGGSIPPSQPVVDVSGGSPPKPPDNDVTRKINKLWDNEAAKSKGDPSWKAFDFWKTIEEKTLDKFSGINKLTKRAKVQWKKNHPNEEFPIELDAELQAANLSGAADAGLQRAKDTWNNMKLQLGKGIHIDNVNTYLHLEHNKTVLAMHPKRKVSGEFNSIKEIDEAIEILRSSLGEERFQKVQAASQVVVDHWSTYLQRGVDTGLINQELADSLRETYPFYNPIQYIHRIMGEEGRGAGKAMSVSSNDLRQLSELGSEAARERPLDTVARISVQKEILIKRNEAAKTVSRVVESDLQLQEHIKSLLPNQKGELSFMENGERTVRVVPKWLENEAKILGQTQIGDLEKLGAVLNAASRFGMTTANLAFFIPNFAVDTLTAMIAEGVSPLRVIRRLGLGLKDIAKEDKILAEIKRSGGSVSGFWGKTPEQIVDAVNKQGQLVIRNKKDFMRILGLPIESITKIGQAVEMAPRAAVFETHIKRGDLPEQAAFAARRATIDFQRAGTAIRQANSLFLYLNAGIQGTAIPFRALRDNPRSRWWLAGYLGMIVGLYAWNRQFREYEDVPDYAKYGSLVVMLPSEEYDKRGNKVPHYITVIPNLREWALFSGPLTYGLRKLDGEAPEEVGQFLEAWLPPLNPAGQIVGEGGLPVPTQIGQTLVELQLNKDTFRQTEIVPAEMQLLPPEEQFNEWTSMTARRVGKALGMSPMKLDFFVKNVFGGVGSQVITVLDNIFTEAETDETIRIELLTQQLEAIQSTSPPGQIPARRADFLEALSPEDREAVLSTEMKPDQRIPVLSTILNRLYREKGGQIYQTAKANARAALENNEDFETPKVEFVQKTQQNALNFLNGSIGSETYKDLIGSYRQVYRGQKDEAWRMRLIAGAVADEDVQEFLPDDYKLKPEEKSLQQYYQLIDRLFEELEGVETDDNVSKVWRQVDEYVSSLPNELQTFVNNHKDDWINDLSPEAQKVERTRQTDLDVISNTRFAINGKTYDSYWDIPTMTEQRDQGKKGKQVIDLRGEVRKAIPKLDASLAFWFDYVTTLKTQEAANLLAAKADKLGRPRESVPALAKIMVIQPQTTTPLDETDRTSSLEQFRKWLGR